MERAMELDRAWFAAYPTMRQYTRPAIAGEFLPFMTDELAWREVPAPRREPGTVLERIMLVTQIRPGERTREPCYVLRELDLAAATATVH